MSFGVMLGGRSHLGSRDRFLSKCLAIKVSLFHSLKQNITAT